MTIGTRIAQRRNELQMSQKELAELVQVPESLIHAWEMEEEIPETEKLVLIARALQINMSWLFGENGTGSVHAKWELHDAMFSVDHMLWRVQEYAQERNMEQTKKALKLMQFYHKHQKRKGKDGIPYIVHPLMMACHAFALGIGEDEVIATCLLHDVLEDCDATVKDLGVKKEILEAVQLVSFLEKDSDKKEEAKQIYYDNISKNRLASIVKLLDRCNNVSTMATGFSKKKIAEYIDETEKYVLPILDRVKHGYEEYYDVAFLLKYQMVSVMESLKRTI